MKYKVIDYEDRFYIGVEYPGGVGPNTTPNLGQMWSDFLRDDLSLLQDISVTEQFIGLECYPPDFRETKTFLVKIRMIFNLHLLKQKN